MAGLLLDTAPSPEQATYIRAVKTSGQALLSLIDEILDFSKIEAGRIDLLAEPFDIRAVVEDAKLQNTLVLDYAGRVVIDVAKKEFRAADLATTATYPNPRPVTRDGVRAILDDAFNGRPPR